MKLLVITVAILVLIAGTEAARLHPNRRFKQLREQAGDDIMKNSKIHADTDQAGRKICTLKEMFSPLTP